MGKCHANSDNGEPLPEADPDMAAQLLMLRQSLCTNCTPPWKASTRHWPIRARTEANRAEATLQPPNCPIRVYLTKAAAGLS